MKLWLPTVVSQRILFKQDFRNLTYVLGSGGYVSGSVSVDRGLDTSGGGYVVYSSRGADAAWQLPWWTVRAKILVPASGSARCVVACGDPVIGDRFELGLSSSNTMQLVAGATVTSDDALSAGEHTCLWVYTGGVVEFWADGVRIGTATVALGSTTPPRLFVGMASDGASRAFGGTIYSLDVYTYPMDEQEAFLASAVEGWTPRDLLSAYGGSYDDGVYWDGDEDGAYTLNDQPALLNAKFLNWTGDNPDNWNVPAEGANYYVTQAGRALRMVSDGTAIYISQSVIHIVGNRYVSSFTQKSGSGILGALYNSFIYPTGNGRKSVEYTASVIRFGIKRINPCDVIFTDVTLENLSAKYLNPYTSGTLAGSKYSQSTATLMTWQSPSGLGTTMEVADYTDLSVAPSTSGDWTWYGLVVAGATTGGADYNYFAGLHSDRSAIGFEKNTGKVMYYDGTVTGNSTKSAAAFVSGDQVAVCVRRVGTDLLLRVNGVDAVGASGTGVDLCRLGGRSDLYQSMEGSVRKQGLILGMVSDVHLTQISDYLMRAKA